MNATDHTATAIALTRCLIDGDHDTASGIVDNLDHIDLIGTLGAAVGMIAAWIAWQCDDNPAAVDAYMAELGLTNSTNGDPPC